MSGYEWPGFFLVLLVGLLVGGMKASRLPRRMGKLLLLAIGIRVLGSLGRHTLLFTYYGGIGDATGYFGSGVSYAAALWRLDFSFFDSSYWWAGRWWGTQAVKYISGFVLAIIGPTMRGEFLFFSLLSLVGLYLLAQAFQAAYPQLRRENYARWLWFWPSLWFWTSSVGKDALLVFSVGLIVYGYMGWKEHVRWVPLLLGMCLALIVRPHIAIVLGMSLAAAFWLSLRKNWTTIHVFQGLLFSAIGVIVLRRGLNLLELDTADSESFQEFASRNLSMEGGSAITAPGLSIEGLPLSLINMLFRPFLWEAHNLVALLAAFEITGFWILVWWRRSRIVAALKEWRTNRLLRLAVPLTLSYVLLLGMTVGNLGIMVRHRTVVFPFLLLLLAISPTSHSNRAYLMAYERRIKSDSRSPSRRMVGARPLGRYGGRS